MADNNKPKYKIGEFFIKNGIINQAQLEEALELQTFNKGRLIGEILVTMGHVTKEKLIMSLETYMVSTGLDKIGVSEWLDQEEIDIIIKKLEASLSKSS